MMRVMICTLTTIGFLAAAGTVLAQATGPNGGLLGGSGAHQTELVVSSTELIVYLLEDGKAHDTKGANARVVVQQGGKTTTLGLVDQDGKKLVAKLPSPLDKGAVVVVTGKDGHGDQFNARYAIK